MSGQQLPGDMWGPHREHVRRMLKTSLGPVLEVSKVDDRELAEQLFEVAESGLLPTQYTAACMEAGTRLIENGGER